MGREAIRQIFGYEIGGSHRPLRASSHIIVSQLDLITSQKFVRITKKTESMDMVIDVNMNIFNIIYK